MEGFMSKHLIKILTICALVVLLPLIVVGAALCVTEAVPVELTVFQGGEVYEGDEEDYPSVVTLQIDNESPVVVEFGSSITVKKNSLITLSYPDTNSVVYDFDGWFLGTDQQVTDSSKPEETATKYSFSIRANTNITAIKNIKKFDIVYSGEYDDGSPIEYETDLVKYGDALYVPTNKTEDVSFLGWYVVGDETTLYNNATFTQANRDSENNYITLTLEPMWSNQMTITYYDSDRVTVIEQKILSENEYNTSSYSLLGADDIASYLTPGYEFNTWLDSEGEPVTTLSQIQFVKQGSVSLYLDETKIEIAQINYYTEDGTLIKQERVRREDYSTYTLLSATDPDVLANIPEHFEFDSWEYNDIAVSTINDIPFVDGEIRIVLAIKEMTNTVINYYTNVSAETQQLIATVKLYQEDIEEYELLEQGTNEILDEYIALLGRMGMRFIGWTDSGLEEFTKQDLVFGQNYNLYMNVEIIDYTVNVQYNAIDTDQVTTLPYNASNLFGAGYTKTRDYYTFVGLVYNNVTYYPRNVESIGIDYVTEDGFSLGTEIATAAEQPITVTALWQANEEYGEYSWVVGFGYENSGMWNVYTSNGDGSYTSIRNSESQYIIFEDNDAEGFAQLEDIVFEDFFQNIDVDNLYVRENGLDGDYVKATITGINVYIDSMAFPVSYSDDIQTATYADLIDVASTLGVSDFESITIRFICEVA